MDALIGPVSGVDPKLINKSILFLFFLILLLLHLTTDCHGNPIQVIDLPVVLLQVAELSEVLLAEGAGVGFHACVDTHVLGQVAGVGKRLGAVGTLVGLGLCVVPDRGNQ